MANVRNKNQILIQKFIESGEVGKDVTSKTSSKRALTQSLENMRDRNPNKRIPVKVVSAKGRIILINTDRIPL